MKIFIYVFAAILITWRALHFYQRVKIYPEEYSAKKRYVLIALEILLDIIGLFSFGALLSYFALAIAQNDAYVSAIRNMSNLHGRESTMAAFDVLRSVVPWAIILMMFLFFPQMVLELEEFLDLKFPKKKPQPALPQPQQETQTP